MATKIDTSQVIISVEVKGIVIKVSQVVVCVEIEIPHEVEKFGPRIQVV